MLMPLNQVVQADTVEEERILLIESDPDINYDSILNIVNISNDQYTNDKLLVNQFEQDTGISGGFSGSFLPPAKFQLNDANTSASNTNLVLSSIVEFNKKNLLSGASISWWRCPYFYNSSVSASRDWSLNMSIYHVDLPRLVNFSFANAGVGDNYPVVPTASAHPSLIFQKNFTNCGSTQDDEQWNFTKTVDIPANDTLVDPDLPFNETTNPHLYNVTLQYSFAWFNVSAPIYPNESYMVIWNINDTAMGSNDAGSMWITASDIGNNNYGRTLFCWNNRTVYELPIDLDSSVIFQIGMGAGITGTKLAYNNPDYTDHTASFDNPNFKSALYQLESDFSQTFAIDGWTTSVSSSSDAWVKRNPTLERAEWILNRTGSISSGTGTTGTDGDNSGEWGELIFDQGATRLATEGVNFKFEVDLRGTVVVGTSPDYTWVGAEIKFELLDTTSEQARFGIRRGKYIDATGLTYFNDFYYYDSSNNVQRVTLPDSFPQHFYISVQSDIPDGEVYVHIYHPNIPNRIYFSHKISNPYISASSINGIAIAGSLALVFLEDTVTDGEVSIAVTKVSGVERTNLLSSSWTIQNGFNIMSISNHDFYTGYETIVPDANFSVVNKNTKAVGFTHRTTTGGSASLKQTQAIPLTNRRVFASGYYRMLFNDSSDSYAGSDSYFEFIISGFDGSIWHSVTERYYALDGSWHQVSTGHLMGSFTQINVTIRFMFPTPDDTSRVDLKMGFFDNLEVYSIDNSSLKHHTFNQKVDQQGWSSTNYYTLMIPFRYIEDPEFEPFCELDFKNSAGTTVYSTTTYPTDVHDDFLIAGIKTSLIPSTASTVKITLYNFGNETYLFLHDRNSDFDLNTETEYQNNYFTDNDEAGALLNETFFSPYYSLKTTSGEWLNADSTFTTTFFYFVIVRFVEFNDNDPEVILIQFDTVDVEDIDQFRFKLSAFGDVYDDEEWKLYLDIRNRPSFLDKIVDWFMNTPLGQFIGMIGKFIYDTIKFIVPLVESLVNLILEAVVFIISIVIYFFAVFVMWNIVQFSILLAQNRPEEAIAVLSDLSGRVTSLVGGAVGKLKGVF